VPGVAKSARWLEIFVVRDLDTLERGELGDQGNSFMICALPDISSVVHPNQHISARTWLSDLVPASWDVTPVYLALPLERGEDGYVMGEPLYRNIDRSNIIKRNHPTYNDSDSIFPCSETTLIDIDKDVSTSCLRKCIYQLDYLNNGCCLGSNRCGVGLG
jgi:hypothetical protein